MPMGDAVDYFDQPGLTVDRDAVALHNALVGGGRGLSLTLDGVPLLVRFGEPAASGAPTACWADLRLDDARARVTLDRLDFLPTLKAVVADAPLPEALPDDLFGAIAETLLAPGSEVVAAVTLEAAGLGAPPPANGHEAACRLGLEVATTDGAALAHGTLVCDDAFAARLAGALAPGGMEAAADGTVEPDAVGRIQLRSVLVPLDEFEALALHDIVVLGGYRLGGRLPGRIFFAPGLFFVGTTDGESLRVEPEPKQSEPTEESPAQDAAPVDIGKLPVRVSLELGSVTVSLAELRGMAAGTVLEIPVPVDAPVTLRANGREIGKGALLRIEDHVGVRILELYHKE